jgi:type II secretory pathway pseudopilin PulG
MGQAMLTHSSRFRGSANRPPSGEVVLFRRPAVCCLGLSLIEFVVIIAIIVVVAVVLLMVATRNREEARLVACRMNLGQIGRALAMYDQNYGSLPSVTPLASLDSSGSNASGGISPLRTLLETFQLPDLTELGDPRAVATARPGPVPGEMPVRGFVCPSDPNATGGLFAAPISYRAVTGDGPSGSNGAFAPGQTIGLSAVEVADGQGYTAGFSERLVGDNQRGSAHVGNYEIAPERVSLPGCPENSDPAVWRGDAGSSWRFSDYRSTLYNHALRPNGRPSCVARDGKSAFIGASSGHVRGIHLLMLDGSVKLIRPSIDPVVWREFATIGADKAAERSH